MSATALRRLFATELRLVAREPAYAAAVLILPLALFVIFGLSAESRRPDASSGGRVPIDTILPSFAISLALGQLAFYLLPAYLVEYRDKGILRRLSTTPASPALLLASQALVNLVLAALALLVVLAIGGTALGMAMPADPGALMLVLVLGAAALFGLGLVVAAVTPSPKVTWLAGSALFFPSLFLAGVWLPREQMPEWLARAGDFSPLGAFRGSLEAAWAGNPLDLAMLATLVLTALAGTAIAIRLFRWE